MSIQSEINQGLALTSLIFNQSPLAEAARKRREAGKMSEATEGFIEARTAALNAVSRSYPDRMQRLSELQEEITQRRKEEFEKDPTSERAKLYEAQVKREQTTKKLAQSLQRATTSLAEEQDSKRLTTQNFAPAMSDDIRNSEVFFGKTSLGRVKDLKPHVQEQISKELEKEEKTSE